MSKINKTSVIIFICLLAAILLIPSLRSHSIMGVASWIESFDVLGKNEDLTLKFAQPDSARDDGLDWYSKLLLFNTNDLTYSRIGLDGEGTVHMSIYYTFGDFANGSSSIFDLLSPYNSAFYGAYIIKLKPATGTNEMIDLGVLTGAVTRYDYTNLILSQLGLNSGEAYFEPKVEKISTDITAFGSEQWTQIDVHIKTRAVVHQASDFRQQYLQYGKPKTLNISEDFPTVTLYGRTYSKYFAKEDLYVIFYVQAGDKDLVEKTDEFLLSNSKVIRK
jgi:hypothetical protein